MTQLSFDATGNYQAHCPRVKDVTAILTLGQTFVTYDQSLGVNNGTPFTALIATQVRTLATSQTDKTTGTTQFVVASGSIKQLDKQAKVLVKQMQGTLSGACAAQPTRAVEWGFPVRQTGRGAGTLLLPANREDTLQLLNVYIPKEESRPEAERFTFPRLEEVRAVRDALTQQLATRQQSGSVKEGSRASSFTTAAELLDLLQAALAYLIVTHFNFKVTPELQAWGYEVIERKAAKAADSTTEPAA